MSHFTVLVTGNDVEAALAPFQENNMGDCPEQYMQFEDQEAEFLEEYENEGTARVVLPDGTCVLPWDRMFDVPNPEGFGTIRVVPPELERRKVPFKETYATFEQFVSEWHGHSERDEKTGRYGCWSNPNSKWDWYQIGGRWSGSLKLKAGAEGQRGEKSWAVEDEADVPGTCDQARAGDIDWQAMIDAAAVRARDDFRQITAIVAGRPVQTWAQLREQHGGNLDAARDAFHAQPVVADVKAAFPDRWMITETLESVLAFNGDEEAYVDFTGKDHARQYALLHEGQWHEPGSMGWFGCSTETFESKREFTRKYWETVLSLPDDTLVSIVDCHI
jgi:hypothetical protein